MRSPNRVDGINKYRGRNAPADSKLFQIGASILYSVHHDKCCIACRMKNIVKQKLITSRATPHEYCVCLVLQRTWMSDALCLSRWPALQTDQREHKTDTNNQPAQRWCNMRIDMANHIATLRTHTKQVPDDHERQQGADLIKQGFQ